MLRWRVAVLPVLAAVALVLAAFGRLRRTWRDVAEGVALALPLLLAVALTAGPAPSGAGRSAASLAALRAEPYRLPDPDRRDALVSLVAWPAAALLGDQGAVRLVAAVASASALLLGYALFRSAGLDPMAAVVGQVTLAALPVLALGPGPVLFAHALPQALQLLLLAHLVRRLGHLEGARDTAAAFAFLLLAQAASAVATLEVALFAAVAALFEAAAGARRRALRLAVSGALATAAVVLVRYGPRLLDWAAHPAPAAPLSSWSPLALGLAALVGGAGLAALPEGTRAPRLVAAALVAGLAAAVLGPLVDPGSPTPGGLGLLAPAVACAPAALAARLRSPWTGPAAPGSRS
ncbi:MAG TPA: hypothetical protein VMT87_17355 [Vicinamibacteria bacterium]|nr:hypothetical protein [Vicinamibacteria bacterium]